MKSKEIEIAPEPGMFPVLVNLIKDLLPKIILACGQNNIQLAREYIESYDDFVESHFKDHEDYAFTPAVETYVMNSDLGRNAQDMHIAGDHTYCDVLDICPER